LSRTELKLPGFTIVFFSLFSFAVGDAAQTPYLIAQKRTILTGKVLVCYVIAQKRTILTGKVLVYYLIAQKRTILTGKVLVYSMCKTRGFKRQI